MQYQTVLTNAFKGEDLNGYVPIFKQYAVAAPYNFRTNEMQPWSRQSNLRLAQAGLMAR